MSSGHGLDRLARELALGEISRRAALQRLLGPAIALGLASVPGASAFASADSKACPPSRRCGEKCCPNHAKCRHGKCKCDSGYTRCGKKCVDLKTSAKHCGSCGNGCDTDEACVGGICGPPSITILHPDDGTEYSSGASIPFIASATDPQDGDLSGDSIVWTDSLDGQIGTGESFSKVLSDGEHEVTATATDSDGHTAFDVINVKVSS